MKTQSIDDAINVSCKQWDELVEAQVAELKHKINQVNSSRYDENHRRSDPDFLTIGDIIEQIRAKEEHIQDLDKDIEQIINE